MKALTQPQKEQRATNCNGPFQWFTVQRFTVESSDVGASWEDYLGYRHARRTFTAADVGRVVEVVTQGAHYRCWYFHA